MHSNTVEISDHFIMIIIIFVKSDAQSAQKPKTTNLFTAYSKILHCSGGST